ncbi:MAG: HIT family protein [Candidatus Micrarchaeia archaeon]
MNKCVFCNKKKMEEQGILYEDDQCYVTLNLYPISYGHLLVIPKKHYKDIIETPPNTLSDMAPIIRKFVIEVNKMFKPKNIMIITNAGDEEEVKHFHIHIIPIYEKRGVSSRVKLYKMRKKLNKKEKEALLKDFKKFENKD